MIRSVFKRTFLPPKGSSSLRKKASKANYPMDFLCKDLLIFKVAELTNKYAPDLKGMNL